MSSGNEMTAAAPAGLSPRDITRQFQSRPRLTLAVVLAWLGYTVLLGILYARMPAGPDEQIFDYIAWVANHGGRLYVDVSEQNFPGMMWIHELSTALFGAHAWSHRLFDYFELLAGCAVLAAALAPEVGRVRALLVVPMYQAMYVTAGLWSAGQRDFVAAPLLLAAGLSYRARTRGGSRGWLVLFAAALIGAALIRPTYALYAALIVLADAATARGRGRPLSKVISDGAAATVLCAALIGAIVLMARRAGTLTAFVESALHFNSGGYSQSETFGSASKRFASLLGSWHWYAAFAVAGGWLWFRRTKDRFLWALVALVAATGIVSAYVMLKGFGYHLCAFVTTAAVFDAYLVLWSLEGIARRSGARRLAIAAVICGVAVLGLASKVWGTFRLELEALVGRGTAREAMAVVSSGTDGASYADLLDAAALVRDTVPEDQSVLVWSRAVHINFLGERRSPSRFITVGMLIAARPPLASAEAWTREFDAALALHPPALVFLPARTNPEGAAFWTDPNPSGPVQILRRQLTTRYAHVADFGSLEAYRLGPPAGS